MLGIDTSGKSLGLAICHRGELVTSSLTNPGLRHGEILQGRVDDFLRGSIISFGDLSGISVILGPGSFTGLRIGMAAAKGYCYALKLPLAGLSTLSAGAQAAGLTAPATVVITDARRNEIYYAVFDCSNNQPRRLSPDCVGSINSLRANIDDDTVISGPGHLKEQIIAEFSQCEYHISDDLNLAEPAGLQGERDVASGNILDMSAAVPIYLRSGF